MQTIQLSWEDPATNELHQAIYHLPVALGRDLAAVLSEQEQQSFATVMLNSRQISRFHASIFDANGTFMIEDHSKNGSILNGNRLLRSSDLLRDGDRLQLGPFVIQVSIPLSSKSTDGLSPILETESQFTELAPGLTDSSPAASAARLLFDNQTDLLNPDYAETNRHPDLPRFINDRAQIALEHLRSGIRLSDYDETTVVSIGGGQGSFAFVDALRIAGMPADRIRVLGRGEPAPYSRYRYICRNSQIPDYERLRSGSDSCPDNLWAFPSYALREAWRECFDKGRAQRALGILWQVFAEPVFADTYTPRAANVFAAMEREAKRIGWYRMWHSGQVCAIRQTTDDRYLIIYRDPEAAATRYKFLVAQYVHLSTGYTGVRFLDDLQQYRRETGDTQAVVNAYEPHEQVYDQLMRQGGTVVVRGEGIVASRIIQRLAELRQVNPQVKIVHLVRSDKTTGNRYKRAKRYRENGWEFQPFNWPKATWGGVMRSRLEAAPPTERAQLLRDWGGTTTASRQDWRRIVQTGQRELWYERQVGVVKQIERLENGALQLTIQRGNLDCEEHLKANFIIDATGLVAKPLDDPLLGDLIRHYRLPLNPLDGLHVANDFELEKMRNGRGRMYVSGVMTLGGPYAPVDTFLGLQYVAQRAIANMHQVGVKQVHRLVGVRSVWQWLKWAGNQAP